MGKSRNAKNKFSSGGAVRHGYGAAASKSGRFSVFEFDDDESLVETEARKSLSKFGTKRSSEKSARHRQSVDKYAFLEFFTQGTMTKQNDPGSDISYVSVTDGVLDDRNFENDVITSPASLNNESYSFSFPKHHRVECYSCGAKSCSQASRKSGGCTNGRKHTKVHYIDSDEDLSMELRLSNSSFDQAETEGSLEEQSTSYRDKNNDLEVVVVVAPIYAKYGNWCYIKCLLTFSQRGIRLEESPLCERNKPYCLEWSTFDILKIEEYQQSESVNGKADIVNLHLKSRDRNVAEAGNRNSGSVELEFVVLDDSQWFRKKEAIKSLDLKYRTTWKTIMSGCSFNKSFEGITYPGGDPDAVFISRRDIELLQPRTFINDTIIDFYIKYLMNQINPEDQHRFHFFNTFFFQKLANVDQDLSTTWEGRDAFQSVRKWTRNVNLFEKDYIFIPVNFSLHWSLIVICHPGGVANLRDKGMDDSSKVPCILHMDSIRGRHRGFEDLIRSFLWEEWKERQSRQEEDIPKEFLDLDFIVLQPPQQENWFDCGLFLLHYAELFLELASTFSTTNFFDFLNEDWFHPVEVSLKKRDHIRKLIHRIVEDNGLGDPSTACHDKHHQSGRNEGDSSVHSVQENDVKQSSPDIKFKSSDDCEVVKGQQIWLDILKHRNINESATHEGCESHKQVLPINQFSNMMLPMQEGLEKEGSSPAGGTISCYEADEDDKPSTSCAASSFRGGEMTLSQGISKTYSGKPLVIIDEPNEEMHVPEVAATPEREKERYENSSISGEDLAACVVEDSEEECGTESVMKRIRRPSSLISPIHLMI